MPPIRVSIIAAMVPGLLDVVGLQEARNKSGFFVKVWVLRVDVRELNGNQVLDHRVCVGQAAPQHLRHYVNDLLVQFRESQHLLLDLVSAVLDDTLHLFVYQFDATLRRLLQTSDLPLNQQLK